MHEGGIVAVVGARGCGKTSLIRALTGADTDRLQEEKERGLSIEAGFAHLDLGSGTPLGVADLPGHEKYVRHLVAGLAGVSAVLLVIAADQGVMAQTREHLAICEFLGICQGAPIITRTDLVAHNLLRLVEDEARECTRGSFLKHAPLSHCSPASGEGLAELMAATPGLVAAESGLDAGRPFRMTVDRVFTLPDGGTVVTGAALSGKIGAGEALSLFPRQLPVRVGRLQVHGRDQREAVAGSRVVLNLHGVDETMVKCGDLLASPGYLAPSHLLDVDVTMLPGSFAPLPNRTPVRIHLDAAELAGLVVLLETEELAPGSTASAQLFLEEHATALPGDRFLIRSYSPAITLGGGVVHNGVAPRRKRQSKEIAELFSMYRRGAIEDLALFHLRESAFRGLTLPGLGVRLFFFRPQAQKGA